ncbi:hypothetical protein [Vibrio aquimaris]|uniref:Uncharacterized protein n=1 Tax=Vibrio aquimaris TaxID=2587862 RepID=A0A5P9CPR4_9VIBR|nr:hypothetical protein [Vibrio aquimaris]QFT28249.1 hypothetical protein FIV01_17805 [Vibrio aquimaris]
MSSNSLLSSAGAKQRNFVRRYMQDKESMLKLPRDPNSIMFGYWW